MLYLNAQHELIEYVEELFGTLTSTCVYPRELVKRALVLNASAVVLAHNHRSGKPEPSDTDEALTRSLSKAPSLVDVRTLDHIVVGGGHSVSFSERGLLCLSAQFVEMRHCHVNSGICHPKEIMSKLSTIRKQIAALEAQAARIAKEEIDSAIGKVKSLMADFGLTIEHLTQTVKGRAAPKKSKSAPKKTSAKKAASTAKYADPKSGKTWSGFGRAPGWIASAKSRDAFLVSKGVALTADAAPVAITKKVAAKPASKAAVAPAKKAARSVAKKAAPVAKKIAATAKKVAAKKAASKKVASVKKAAPKKSAAKNASASGQAPTPAGTPQAAE